MEKFSVTVIKGIDNKKIQVFVKGKPYLLSITIGV